MAFKPGYKTTEFWMTVLPSAWTMFSGSVPAPWNVALPIIAGGLYSLARGLAKAGVVRGDLGEHFDKK